METYEKLKQERSEEDLKMADTLLTESPIIVTTSGWKRFLINLGAFLFVASGVYLIFNEEALLGTISVVLFTYLGISYFKQSHILLVADREGIVPVCILIKGATTKIPWQKIENIYISKQTVRFRNVSNENNYLAFKAKDSNYVISDEQLSQTAMRQLRKQIDGSIDDGGGALFYIPLFLISEYSPEELVRKLNILRRQATPNS